MFLSKLPVYLDFQSLYDRVCVCVGGVTFNMQTSAWKRILHYLSLWVELKTILLYLNDVSVAARVLTVRRPLSLDCPAGGPADRVLINTMQFFHCSQFPFMHGRGASVVFRVIIERATGPRPFGVDMAGGVGQ